ncbi:hypothetical protein ACUXAV_004945 [Cupriavidus metallidurans]|jgi:hypothetical protein|nr:hypothetical protein C3Z06_31265 [Cupriavidus metallidurans]MCA3185240.1 hypothetical protein [Cupriavidus sp.]QWE98044.1 hypothetical protein KLP38_29600 [Cupriavidus sp. EM10]GMG94686.1 hypothetical protein Cmtc_59060 [Cupriavidus sp. TKC]MCA3188616.1 hypothetical protein [Cupriavidus sp.]
MSTSRATRRDPMADVMPLELLEVAHLLISRGQNELYWERVPLPKRPVGQVRYEVARQAATFVVPLVGLTCAAQIYGATGLLLGLPLAWLGGYFLDLQLKSAIGKKKIRDDMIDAGRYKAVGWLAAQMGMRPDEITLATIRKMNKDYVIVKARMDLELARREEARKVAHVRQSPSSDDVHHDYTPGVVAAAGLGAATAYTSVDDDDDYYDRGQSNSPAVNPANGMPMIAGTHVDVNGNMFGTDTF